MKTICPYCGHEFDSDTAQSGSTPATCLCPGCRHELDRPGAAVPPSPPPPPPPGWDQVRAGEDTGPDPGQGPAWEQSQGNFFERLGRTIAQVLMHPVITLGAPARPGLAHPLGFGIILGTLGSVLMSFWNQVLHPDTANSGLFGDSPVMMVILSPLLVLIQLFIVAALVHFFLWIVRGTGKGYQATFRVVGYTSAANIFFALPYLGTVVATLWSLVILVAGLAAVHATGRGRVVLSLLIPILLLMVLGLMAAILAA